MLYYIRWIVGLILLIGSFSLVYYNGAVFWIRDVKKRMAPSWIPLFGGLLGSGAIILIPGMYKHVPWWIPFIIDYGCLPGFLDTAYFWLITKDEIIEAGLPKWGPLKFRPPKTWKKKTPLPTTQIGDEIGYVDVHDAVWIKRKGEYYPIEWVVKYPDGVTKIWGVGADGRLIVKSVP
jgi:hypothetical protein